MNDIIESTEKISLNPKRQKIGWIIPSINKPFNQNIKCVNKINTKYYSVIKYYFNNKPLNCDIWENHIEKGETVNFKKHWDMFLFIFLIDNVKEINSVKLNFNEPEYKLIEINSELTLVFKNTTKKELLFYENDINYELIKNLRFVTHYKKQKNIYNNVNSYILHLVLNERMADIEDKNIILNGKYIDFTIKIKKLYESLYTYYTKNSK